MLPFISISFTLFAFYCAIKLAIIKERDQD